MPRSEDQGFVGQRLCAARLQRGLSQGALAKLTGVSASYISRIETGKIHPTVRTASRLASILRISLQQLAMHQSPDGSVRGRCPVSASGQCLVDTLRPEV
jgi:transcriptional regulator with XRE-family HTH domain